MFGTESPTMLQCAAVSLAVLAIALSGCGPTPPPPAVALVVNPDITDVVAGQSVALIVETSGKDLRFKWSAARGKLSTFDEPAVFYTAPDSAGVDIVTVEVSTSSGTTIENVNFNVIVPTPTPTSTATPTNIPTPTPTPTATPTNTPTPMPTSTATPTFIPTTPPSFQNFEPDNGTPGDYFRDVWYMACSFSEDIVYEGQRSICCDAHAERDGTGGNGGTVGIYPSSSDPIDLSSARTLSVWVYDTQGNNIVQLRLRDNNDALSNEVWSEMHAEQSNWTEITWSLSDFTGVDLSQIKNIELYEWGDGIYYFDAVSWQIAMPTPTPTDTPVPPTDTPVLPTDTPVPPTDTPVPPTAAPTPTPFYCTDSGGGGTETLAVEPPRTVTRIRIDMEERATEHGDSLWEVEAYGPDTGNTNLVIGGEARASSEQTSTGCEWCVADMAIDGDTTTRWSSDWYDPQWLEIALPELQVVNRIVLRWETAYAKEYCVTVAEPTCLITEPADGDDDLGHENEVRATCSDVPDSLYASVLVYSHHDFNYYPQSGPIGSGSGQRRGVAYLGTETEGIGDGFDIIVALANEAVSVKLRQDAESYSSYVTLPDGVEEKDRITVTRGQ